MMRFLITGGAGFVGASLAEKFKLDGDSNEIVVLDNLKRRGSEINLSRFKNLGVEFVHGDVRNATDVESIAGNFDVVIDASAEPSVLAGMDGSPRYIIDTNLGGTTTVLEFARQRAGVLLFLSTSRVYSINPLLSLNFRESETRLELEETQAISGISGRGISENFPTHLPRSFYGATKLASEFLVQEYGSGYGLDCVINRCGVIAGPGQFGKVDQGVFTHWVVCHHFLRDLKYTGFGGLGKQVRDLLHPDDLYALLKLQIENIDRCKGDTFNVGGGHLVSTSLLEYTDVCQEVTGNKVKIENHPDTTAVDIPIYISDCSHVSNTLGWSPTKSVANIADDIHRWICDNEELLKGIFAP